MSCRVIVLYDSRHGSTQQLAEAIANGIESSGAEALLRVPPSSASTTTGRDLEIDPSELKDCDGLALGSPTRFGHMTAALQAFWEKTSRDWLKGSLIDKPSAVFTSSASLHGGQEATLLTLALPLIHHGMSLIGIPYSESGLLQTEGGGTPYGASHVDGDGKPVSNIEQQLAYALGKRLGHHAMALKSMRSKI